MIYDPVTLKRGSTVKDALNMMREYHIGGIPVVDDEMHLVGIVTNRDLRFERDMDKLIDQVMTSENLVTTTQYTDWQAASLILQENKIEKLPVVEFDKELIKSGVEYSRSDMYKVADVYKDYKNHLVSFTKKINTDEITEDEGIVDISVLNLLFKGKFHEACANEKMLCDILIDLLYDKPNSKGVVWDMCGDTIIDNLLCKSGGIIEYPEVTNDDEDFSCCRKKFIMKQINIGGEADGEI
jgi:CBS domain-containing protein